MRNSQVALFVVGALLTLYVVAATWRSKDAGAHLRGDFERKVRTPRLKQRIAHWCGVRDGAKKSEEKRVPIARPTKK